MEGATDATNDGPLLLILAPLSAKEVRQRAIDNFELPMKPSETNQMMLSLCSMGDELAALREREDNDLEVPLTLASCFAFPLHNTQSTAVVSNDVISVSNNEKKKMNLFQPISCSHASLNKELDSSTFHSNVECAATSGL